MLNDESAYKVISMDPTNRFQGEANEIINILKSENLIVDIQL